MRSYANFNKKLAKRYDDWMVAMHYKAHTRAAYAQTIRMFVEFLGRKSITTVTHWEIRQFMTQVTEEGASWGRTYRHLGTLRVFYDFLNLGGVVSYVAPRLVKLRPPKRELPPVLSEEQVQRLIAATQTLRERALVEIFYGSGCRLREVTHLRVNEVDLAAKTARVSGKFGKVRIVLLTESAINALKAYLGDRQSGFVFREDRRIQKGCLFRQEGCWKAIWRVHRRRPPTSKRKTKVLGRIDSLSADDARRKFESLLKGVNLRRRERDHPLSNMAVQVLLKIIGMRAGLKGVCPHMLRRTFATHLYDHGAPPEVIQSLLGHVFLQTTMKYTRLSTGRLVKTFEQCHPRDQINGQASRQ
jgi:site-specific recombinase XerD